MPKTEECKVKPHARCVRSNLFHCWCLSRFSMSKKGTSTTGYLYVRCENFSDIANCVKYQKHKQNGLYTEAVWLSFWWYHRAASKHRQLE